MFYRCPKCGAYKLMTSWASATDLLGGQISAFYCCPSCGGASAGVELESFLSHWKKNIGGLLTNIISNNQKNR